MPIIYGPDGFAVADATVFHGTFKEGETEANARLIAAAPELLAACRNWIEWLDSDGEGDFDGAADKEAAMLNAMRAALAKATGASA